MLKTLTYGKTFTSIEHSLANNKEHFYMLSVKKAKNEFIIEKTKDSISLEECLQELTKNIPVFIIINNKNVITKALSKNFSTAEEAAKHSFPTIQLEDFYIELSNYKNGSVISICRKDTVDAILKYYLENNILVINFSLGNSAAKIAEDLFDLTTITTSNAVISIDPIEAVQIEIRQQDTPYNYNIKGIQFTAPYILGFARILGHNIQYKPMISFENSSAVLHHTFIQNRTFHYGVLSGLAIVFSLLLVNFLCFMQYETSINVLQQEVQFSSNSKKKLELLTNEVALKKELIANLTENSNSKVSYYLDDLAKDLPNSILLNSIHFQPLQKKIKAGKKILFESDKLVVSGISSKPKEFNQWMHTLEAKSWVKSSSVIDYGTGKKSKTSFTIYLFL